MSGNRKKSTNTGRVMNIKWNVNAQHALYRENGTWYERLNKFPGVLFDKDGYIIFQTKEDYESCPQLHLKKQTSCPKGISSISDYVLLDNAVDQASDVDEPKGTSRSVCITNRVIRDSPLARKVKKLHKNRCQVCGLTLELSDGESYAEAHHIRPLGSKHQGPGVDSNIICVCPNCHAKLDYGAIKIDLVSLRLNSEHKVSYRYIDYHNSNIYKGAITEQRT